KSYAELGKDYTVEYFNNLAPGKAWAVVSGTGNYYGTKILFYTIKNGKTIKYDNKLHSNVQVSFNDTAPYSKTGAKPLVVLKDMMTNKRLEEGIDYKLSYSGNKTVGKKGTVVITGKGIYSGSRKFAASFEVTACNIKDESGYAIDYEIYDMVVEKDVYEKVAASAEVPDSLGTPEVSIMDNGKALKENKDYTVENVGSKEAGSNIVCLRISGKGNYTGTIETCYSVMTKDCDIEGASYGKITGVYYYSPTGVELTEADLAAIAPGFASEGAVKKLALRQKDEKGNIPAEDGYYVDYYTGNFRTGTASVVIRGCGKYGGMKTFKFKILPKIAADKVER
ncbi:MAG: hypothetical protein IJU50_09260, partial [Lachnospiraceae bacterium]|nr:hypothetical protein [Lachnospiraceae bacterium]